MLPNGSTARAALVGFGARHRRWPSRVNLAFTRKCNLRCTMCKVHRGDGAGESMVYEEMPDEVFNELDPLILHAREISLGGGGEPLIARRILERVTHIKALNPAVHLRTFTNGLPLAKREVAERLVPCFDDLSISLNAVTTYERIMVGGSFATLQRALANLEEIRATHGRPQQLTVGFVLMRDNLQDILPAAELARDLGADLISYKDLWVRDEAM